MRYDITACIVTYNTKIEELTKAIYSFLNTDLKVKLYISDNSSNNSLKNIIESFNDKRIEYIFNNHNGGYGWGHNKVLNSIKNNSKYHLILNPDIYFEKGVLEELFNYMEEHKEIGHIMPMVKYPNGEIQYLCKRLPTPKDLFLRRFCPIKSIMEKNDYYYEMRDSGYNKILEVPLLSGCFMFLRTDIFVKVNGFDDKFFMYLEDYDLCRRIGEISKVVFYPEVEIIHNHAKESYKNKKLLLEHMKSTIYYFNKWGWFFDKYRKQINKKAENQYSN